MNKTSLYEKHVSLGAKIVEFAGWQMPVMYSSIVEEHNSVRNAVGIFDVSHMGEFVIMGKNASSLLEKLIPTRLSKISPGSSMYSVLCNEKGGVIDDLFIYMISDEEYYLVVNAGTRQSDLQWIKSHLMDNVEVEDISDTTSKIDIQGPASASLLSEIIVDPKLKNLARFQFEYFKYNDNKIMISQSGYTGEFGYEIYLDNQSAVLLWNALLNSGEKYNIKPAGLGARDSLRLESCYSLYGHELSEEINPVEAGLGWLVSSDKNYIAKETLEKLKEEGAEREILPLVMTGKGIPRDGYRILLDDSDIGYITSGGFSPTLQKGIGLALVKKGSLAAGDAVDISIRDKKVAAEVVNRPIYSYNEKKSR